MSETNNNQQTPRTSTYREGLDGYTIVENWYRDRNGEMRCDCTIDDPEGRFVRRYSKMRDALEYLLAHLELARLRAERRSE